MSKRIEKSELNSSSISNIKTLLDNEISDTDVLISTLTSLIEDTKEELKGQGYDAIRNKVSKYISVLNDRKKVAQSLGTAITSGVSAMSSFLDTYDVLDDSELNTITSEIDSINSKINQIEYNYYNGFYEDEDNNSPVNLDYLVGNYRYQLSELKKLQEKLSQLSSADESAFASIDVSIDQVTAYKARVNEIQESSIS